ncbi:MAG: iron ABC transporter permease [Clostridiales bacterium]|nr:iron ABC transporter permease [Clostridiales bacterium]MCD8369787.1 iron ABC transporter permease [Clostridiales bacterium]
MSHSKARFDFWNICSLILMAVFLIFLVYPIGGLLKEAVFSEGVFTLDAFQEFFGKAYYYESIFHSVRIAVCVMAASLILGIPFSYFYSFYRIRGRKVLFVLCLLCTMSAPFIGAYAWILLMGNSGLITVFLKSIGLKGFSIYGFGGIVFVQTLKLFPLVVIYMNGAFRDIDNSLLEAAESMGCKGVERFKRVIMALTMPTILAAALLVFMRSFADFGTPVLIGRGYTTFPVLIYNQYLGENGTNYHFAAAISVIAVLVTAIIFIIQKVASNRFKFTINALHPVEPKKPEGIGGILMHAFCYLLVGIALLPQIYIVNMSFRNYTNSILKPGYSLVNYQKAMEKMLVRSIRNTLIVSVVTLALIVVIAVLIAYLVVRRNNWFNNMIDTISMMPYIMPGAVIGIALVIAFSKKPFVLTGSLVIMIIALAIRRMPFTSRSATAAMMKVPISVEEAALSLGAPKVTAFVKITVPMMSSGIISGAVLSFVSVITEMSSGVILYNNRTITLTISTYSAISSGIYGVAAVFATITMLLTVICLVIYLKFTKLEDVKM